MVDIQQNRLKLNLNGEARLNRKRGIENGQKANDVSFTGHQLKINDKGDREFHFYLPTTSVNAKLEVKLAKETAPGQFEIVKDVDIKPEKTSNTSSSIQSWTVNINDVFKGDAKANNKLRLLYKFNVDDKDVLDKTLTTKVGDSDYNVATVHTRAVIETPHSMYHLMPDNFNPKFNTYKAVKDDVEKLSADQKKNLYVRNSNGTFLKVDESKIKELKAKKYDFYTLNQNDDGKLNKENYVDYAIRQHYFNKFGGTIQGIKEKVDYLKKFGVSRILSTPVFGQDQISNHGYWTTNAYQVTQTFGTYNSFMDINKELYKKGMGWVADGAFVNEGWEGIHINNLTKWGEKSPFFHWFETFDFPREPLKAGVLPENPEAYKNCVLKVVNSPVEVLDKNGDYVKGEPKTNPSYDPSKPTYVQLLDRRFASKEQITNNEPIRKYDNMAPVDPKTGEPIDPNQVKTWQDATLPLLFEVPASEVKEKFKENGLVSFFRAVFNIFGMGNAIFGEPIKPSLETLKKWQDAHLEIQKADKSGGSTLWVGNKDIHKFRFMLPEVKRAELGKKYGLDTLDKATAQVQDYILQVGKFWTDEVDKTLTQYTADKLGEKLNNDKFKNGNPQEKAKTAIKVINDLSNDKQLPAKLKDLVTEKALVNLFNGQYNLNELKVQKAENITDGLMSFPLDSIEFPREICAVLSSPHIKKLANKHDETEKSRYEIHKDAVAMNTRSSIYKKMDTIYEKEMKERTISILNQLEPSIKSKLLNDKGELKDEQAKMAFRLISGDIAKYITVKALTDHKLGFDAEKGIDLTHDGNDFASKQIESGKSVDNPYKGLQDDFYKHTKLISTTPDSEAESLVDALKNGIKNDSRFGDSKEFAKYLNTKLQNVLVPNIIPLAKLCIDRSESGLEWRIDAAKDVADLNSKDEGKANSKDLLEDTIKFWKKFNDTVRTVNPRAYTIGEITDYDCNQEKAMIEETGFTTLSNYRYMFGAPARYAGGKHEDDMSNISLLTMLFGEKSWGDGFFGALYNLPEDSTNLSHVFQSNQDASRLLTKLAFDWSTASDDQEVANIDNMRKQLTSSFEKGLNKSGISDPEVMKAVKLAINTYANYVDNDGKVSTDSGSVLVDKSSKQEGINRRAMQDNFGARGVDHNFDDVIKFIKEHDSKAYNTIVEKTDITKLKQAVSHDFLEPAMKKYLTMLPMIVGCPGNITIYQGEEFAETGMESQGKNMYLGVRNPMPWAKAENDQNNRDYDKKVASFKDKVKGIYSLRQRPELSALANGSTLLIQQDCDIPRKDANDKGLHEIKKDKVKLNGSVNVLYRYNENSDVIVVLNRNGIGFDRDKSNVSTLHNIDISLKEDPKDPMLKDLNPEEKLKYRLTGLPGNIDTNVEYGAVIVDADGTVKEDNRTYKVDSEGKLRLCRVVNGKYEADPTQPIDINGPAMYFYRKDVKAKAEEKNKVQTSFAGKYGSIKPSMKNVNISG